MRRLLIASLITCAYLKEVQAQDKTVRVDTINIRGIVLDEFGKPVPMVELSSKNRKLLNPSHEYSAFTDTSGKFQLNGALVKDTITISYFDNKISIINNSSRFLQINLPPAIKYKKSNYLGQISAKRKYKKSPTPTLEIFSTKGIFDFYGFRVEKLAQPYDGVENLRSFITKQIVYPEKAIANNMEGDVEIGFTVDRDGSLQDYKVLRGIGYGCEEVIIEALKKSHSWSPAIFNMKPIATSSSITINFKLTDK